MTDEEVIELGWELVRKMAKTIKFPDTVDVIEKKDGSVVFRQLLLGSAGSGMLYFYLDINVIADFIRSSEEVLGDLCETLPRGEELLDEARSSFVESFLFGFMKNFPGEMEEAFDSCFDVAGLILEGMMTGELDSLNKPDSAGQKIKGVKKNMSAKLEEHLDNQAQAKKERILTDIINFDKEHAPAKHLMNYFYHKHISEWRDAKNCWDRNEKSKKRKEMVMLEFDWLPEDLIERLGDPDSYEAQPSSIALEHAARLCGLDPNSYKTRTLYNYLQESAQWQETISAEDFQKAREDYIGVALRESLYIARHSLLFNTELSLDKIPFVTRKHIKSAWENIETETDSNELSASG